MKKLKYIKIFIIMISPSDTIRFIIHNDKMPCLLYYYSPSHHVIRQSVLYTICNYATHNSATTVNLLDTARSAKQSQFLD